MSFTSDVILFWLFLALGIFITLVNVKKNYYKIAVWLTILNLIELAVRKFTDFDFLLPKPIKIVSVTLALIFFGIHFYKNKK